MAADKPQMSWKAPGGFRHFALGAANVGDESRFGEVLRQGLQHRDVLQDGSGQHHEIRSVCLVEPIAAGVNGSQPERSLDDPRPIDGGHPHAGPAAPDRERNRATDQAEADDGDACKWSVGQTPHPLLATGSRQILRPIAGAMIRSSAIRRSNCAGKQRLCAIAERMVGIRGEPR